MDSLIHAAVEAEDILSKAKQYKTDYNQFESGCSQEKMTWANDKYQIGDPTDDCRTRYHRNSLTPLHTKESPPEKFDIFKKLHEVYKDLSKEEASQSTYQGLKTTSYLLEKLLSRVNLNTLIINLYPGNKGYSISLKVNGSVQFLHPPDGMAYTSEDSLIETPRWPYEAEELLMYIDNEELPLMLLDLLENEHSSLFYSGCIIAQIRDYRQTYPHSMCDTHHVLLKPTTQSIIVDASALSVKAGHTWEQKTCLEARLTLATSPPLCLDPRPAVGLLATRLAANHLNTPQLRRQARRFSQVSVNRKRKLDQFTHHHGLEMLDVIQRQRAKNSRQSGPHSRLTSKYPKKPPEVFKPVEPPKIEVVPLGLPTEVNIPVKLARAYERPRQSSDCLPQLVEEYILETEKATSQSNAGRFHIKLSILQRPSDQEFLGELYVDRDHVEGEKNGASCRFSLGSRLHANKYIQQFTEIFTEEGRKSVRIKHVVPGQAPRVSFTAGMRESLLLQQRQAAAATAAAATANNVAVSSTVGGVTNIVTSNTPIATAVSNNITSVVGGTSSLVAQSQSVVGGTVTTPVHNTLVSSATILVPASHVASVSSSSPNITSISTARSLPLLQAQLQCGPNPAYSNQEQSNVKQMVDVSGNTTILSAHNRSPAIIHIQQPTSHKQQTNTVKTTRATNPAISALVTSLMNSAQQFQQQAAANQNASKVNAAQIVQAVSSSSVNTNMQQTCSINNTNNNNNILTNTSNSNNNATILNLLNSAPAAMTHPQRLLVTSAPHTYTTQVVSSGSSNSNNANNENENETQPTLLSLASLQGLQNVQVQIPGLAAPISLSLNVSGGAPLIVSPPNVVLANTTHLSLPIAGLMSSGVKGGTAVQLLGRPRRPGAPAVTHGTTQFVTQSLPASQVRRKSNPDGGGT